MAAVLWVGPGAALSGLSAALLWRVWRGRAPVSHVVTPRRRRSQRAVIVHRARRLDPDHVTRHEGIPVTTVARTLVDLTDVLDAHRLANVVHEAAFHNLFDERETREAMARAHGRRRLRVLERALEAHMRGGAGTRSALEDRFLALIRAAGIPEPLVNTAVATGERRIEVDLHWPHRRLCVEVDGPAHERPRTRAEDRARDRALRAAGFEVLRIAGADIERDPAAAIAGLRERLAG